MAQVQKLKQQSGLNIFGLVMALTVGGVLSHELGHVAVARWLGYQTKLHYSSMSYEGKNELFVSYCGISPVHMAGRDRYTACRQQIERRDDLLIALGGPLQTMVSGTIGLMWLLWHRRKRTAYMPMSRSEWCGSLLALLWGRQVFNQCIYGLRWLRGDSTLPAGGDEARIANIVHLPTWSLTASTAMVGVAVCLTVIGYGVPIPLRRRFFCAGVTGSMAGFGLWMGLIGPYLLP